MKHCYYGNVINCPVILQKNRFYPFGQKRDLNIVHKCVKFNVFTLVKLCSTQIYTEFSTLVTMVLHPLQDLIEEPIVSIKVMMTMNDYPILYLGYTN